MVRYMNPENIVQKLKKEGSKLDSLKDKRLIITLSIIGVMVLGVIIYTFFSYKGIVEDKEKYVNMEHMKSERFVVKQEGKGNEWEGRVEFKDTDKDKVKLEKYLTKSEIDYVQGIDGEPKVDKTGKTSKELIKEYSNIAFGEGIECDLDADYYGTTFKECMNRTSQLLANSNKDYTEYVSQGLDTLEESLNTKIGILEGLKYNTVDVDEDKDVKETINYLYKLNQTYLENLEELRGLETKIGKVSMEEMDSEVSGINKSYQTTDNNFELRLVRYLNKYQGM